MQRVLRSIIAIAFYLTFDNEQFSVCLVSIIFCLAEIQNANMLMTFIKNSWYVA